MTGLDAARAAGRRLTTLLGLASRPVETAKVAVYAPLESTPVEPAAVMTNAALESFHRSRVS